MLAIIKEDLYRYIPESYSLNNLIKGMRTQGFRYMFYRRLVEKYGRKSLRGIILKIFLRRYTYKYGFQIGGKIGKGFYIGHFGTIVVSNDAVIGNYCNISHGVTIGAANRGKRKGSPIIGSKVWMGTNAVIVGKINIGNNVLIAPNSYVNFDVPDNSIVIGNPGKIISSSNATEGYINNVKN